MKLYQNLAAVIVLPADPMPTEQFAAEELAKYLKQTMGMEVPVADKAGEGVYTFVIGSPARNAAAAAFISAEQFVADVPGPEGIYINIGEQGTLIAGSDDGDTRNRGALYAVYEYCERYLDCCFGVYTKPGTLGGEIIPTYDELTLPNEVYCKAKADLPYRAAVVQYNNWVWDAEHGLNHSFFDFLTKNRYNTLLTWTGVYEQWKELGEMPELIKRGFSLNVGHHHAVDTWLPPYGNKDISTHYADEHPEYYRLNEDGSRWHPSESEKYAGQIVWCCSNDEMIEEVAGNVNRWIDKNPLVDTIGFWPNDFKDSLCCCEKCAGKTKMENYLSFGNKLARRVREVHPGVKVDIISYSDMWECPKDMEVDDALQLNHSVWATRVLRKIGNPDGSGIINTVYSENILNFRKLMKHVVFYEYYMGIYGNRHYLMPAADEMQAMYKYYVENGIDGSGTQFECFNLWNNLLSFYCFARTAYDTNLSLEDNIRAIGRLFGKAADTIGEIFRIWEDTLNGEEVINKAAIFFKEHVDAEKIYSLFEKALDEAQDDGATANNVRLLRMAFRFTMLDEDGLDATTEKGREMIYMCRNFNSYRTKGGYGIAIPFNYFLSKEMHFGFALPDDEVPDLSKTDRWYQFA